MMKGPAKEASRLTWWIRLRAVPWRHVHISWQRARWALIWIIVSVAILLGAATLSAIGDETGTSSLLSGAVLAVLPVPFYVLLVLWLDRNEPEPLWALVAVFFWGALVSTFVSVVVIRYGHALAEGWWGTSGAEVYAKCVAAPVTEELIKGAALLLFIAFRSEEFDGVVDGMVYASLVGLGFATMENILYYGRAIESGQQLSVFVGRGVFMPFAHPLFTCLIGIGLGWAVNTSGKLKRIAFVLGGLLLAVALHSFWNAAVVFSRGNGRSASLVYVTVMMPVFFLAVICAAVAMHHEMQVMSKNLFVEVEAGVLSLDEHEKICTFRGRHRAATQALRCGGLKRLVLQVEINRAAGHLAFYRNRISQHRTADNVQCEHEALYVERLMALRSHELESDQQPATQLSIQLPAPDQK